MRKKKKKKLWIQVRTNNSIHLRFLTKLLWKLCECNIFLNFKKFSNLRKLLFTRDVFYICILLIWSVDHFELKLINITIRYESIRWEATKTWSFFIFIFIFYIGLKTGSLKVHYILQRGFFTTSRGLEGRDNGK